MKTKNEITNAINEKITDNDRGLITAEALRSILHELNEYEEPIANELGKGDEAISQKTVTAEIEKIIDKTVIIDTQIKNLSSNMSEQMNELSSEIKTQMNELSSEIETQMNELNDSVETKLNDTVEHIDSKMKSVLPLTGGTMEGDIDMNGHRILDTGLETVDKLPTENLYEGRQVVYKGITYTYYNDLWMSLSDDLRGPLETHPEEFLYQPTASDLSIKDGFAKIKSIKGNTIVWNQWADVAGWIADKSAINGFSETTFVDGILTLSTTTAGSYKRVGASCNADFKGHKILLSCQAKCNIANYAGILGINGLGFRSTLHSVAGQYISLNGMNSSWEKFSSIISMNPNNDYNVLGIVQNVSQEQLDEAGGTLSFELKDVKAFDLTLMFGEGNEPATVEDFEAMFPASNYEYNAGELLSHDSTGIKTVGFNAFAGEKAKVLKGQKYYLGGTYTALGFKENENSEPIAFELPSDRYYTPNSNGYIVASGNDICINLSHSGYRNGEYQPYEDYVTQWAEGKKISELTSNGTVVFPHGLLSAGDVYDEITKDSAGKSIAIKRCEADTANLTTTALDTPDTYVLDDDLNLSYKVWDFGTEEILAENLAIPFKGDIEYGFNAVDMIRNNYYEIKSLKDRLNEITSALANLTSAQSAANDE